MKLTFPLFLLFPLLFISTCLVSFILYTNNSRLEFERLRVQDIADSASRGAMKYIQLSRQVDAYGNIKVNPDNIWSVYKEVFLSSLNRRDYISDKEFETAVPAVLIAMNDGYYIRLNNEVTDKYTFTPKIPYARVEEDNYIADTLNGYSRLVIDKNNSKLDIYNNPSGSSHDILKIRQQMIDSISYMINQANKQNQHSFNKKLFYIPKELTAELAYSTVSFNGITLCTIIEDISLLGDSIDVYTTSSSQLSITETVMCYERNNNNYYCNTGYINNLEDIISKNYNTSIDISNGNLSSNDNNSYLEVEILGNKYTIKNIKFYTSYSKAASEGYNPDPLFFRIK